MIDARFQGLGYGRWGWDPVTERLAARYRVLTFDNRGIGESDKPPGPYTAVTRASSARDAAIVVVSCVVSIPVILISPQLGTVVWVILMVVGALFFGVKLVGLMLSQL